MPKSTRRRFLQSAAVGAASPLIATPNADAGDPPASVDQALGAIARLRFKHLTEAQFKTVQTGVQRGVVMGEILKRFALDPVDEPATIFVSDVAE
jgi:hypothetical protein